MLMLLPDSSIPSKGGEEVGGELTALTVIVTLSGSLPIPCSLVTISWNATSTLPLVSGAVKCRLF